MAKTLSIQKEIFNPVFWIIKHHLEDPLVRYIYLFGGSSSAKTYSTVQLIILECLTKGVNTLVARKFGSDLLDSIYSDFKGVINNDPEDGGLGLGDYFLCQQNLIKCKENGAYIRFRGMDDSEKVKGISQFKYVVMEEFSQFNEEDNKQARKRLRGMEGQKIIYIWNPIDELLWQKTNLIDQETWVDACVYPSYEKMTGWKNDNEGHEGAGVYEHKMNVTGNAAYIKTNYMDNWFMVGHPDGEHGFIDHHVLADMKWDKENDYEYYWVYGLGNWGRADRGNEYYKNFDQQRHLVTAPHINELLPFHISIDENVNPYLSATVYQAEGKASWAIDEFTMKHPENTLFHLARDFNSRYAAWKKQPVYIYGDATSQKQDTKIEKGENFFRIFAKLLEDYGWKTYIRVPHRNPGQIIRGEFINSIMSSRGFEEISITISNDMKETIRDLMYLKESMDGKKFKKKVRNKETGVAYEELGHLSDTLDYFVCEYYKLEFDQFNRGKKPGPAILVQRRSHQERANHY